ncbi:MAG: hypothetical protein M1396_00885 [Chloroflexi bacterium]|nr:hypothetical protein [Chloroflexota bacterium]
MVSAARRHLGLLGGRDHDRAKGAQVHLGPEAGHALRVVASWRQGGSAHGPHRAGGPGAASGLWSARLCRAIGHCRHPGCDDDGGCGGAAGDAGGAVPALQPDMPARSGAGYLDPRRGSLAHAGEQTA